MDIFLTTIVSVLASLVGARELTHQALATARQKINEARSKEHIWTSIFYCLGLPASLLSVAAGATVLATNHKGFVAVFSFASAILTGAVTYLKPDARMQEAKTKAERWEEQELLLKELELGGLSDENLTAEEVQRKLEPIIKRQRLLILGRDPDDKPSTATPPQKRQRNPKSDRLPNTFGRG
jgi:hypothetical protein